MTTTRLAEQLQFIVETDKLKRILRQTLVTQDKTQENDAEHSWHLAMMAFLLGEYSNDSNLNISRVMKMVLIHDLVEIYAGDTFCYDYEAAKDEEKREIEAAEKIFVLLPADQAKDLRLMWDEFEERTTQEARFAAALDRLQPLLLNFNTQGTSWKKHDIKRSEVIERNKHIEDGSKELWDYALWLIDESVRRGYLQGS
ncbi:MAG: HD domain-containing protein [Candidatus Thorarchaeota archaeon]|nr:HD domain-containing protein [Candidatus Thorarchaeota archaeon]